MTAAEYRSKAARLRDAAERRSPLGETRKQLLSLAAIYETLAKAAETLERTPYRFSN